MKQVNRFYKSSKWKRKRETILRRDEYQCRQCRRYGKTTAANTVHHIYPLEQYPEFALVSQNLISLCNACHEQMHDRLSGELTQLGQEWVSRVGDLTISQNPLVD